MWQRLRDAAADGVVLGVKWGLALLLALFSVSWALGDYNQVRQRALNGQQAFEFLQQQVKASQERVRSETTSQERTRAETK